MDEFLAWVVVFGWSILGFGAILFYAWYHSRPKAGAKHRQAAHRVPGE